MLKRCLLVTAAVTGLAPALAHGQTRAAAVVPRRDTVALAMVSNDSVAAGQVDRVVRARHREVQFCFEETGLKADPELTGVFAMILTLDTLGTVARVDVSRREWTGPDGAAVETCVMERALTWKFPAVRPVAPARHEVTFHFAR